MVVKPALIISRSHSQKASTIRRDFIIAQLKCQFEFHTLTHTITLEGGHLHRSPGITDF